MQGAALPAALLQADERSKNSYTSATRSLRPRRYCRLTSGLKIKAKKKKNWKNSSDERMILTRRTIVILERKLSAALLVAEERTIFFFLRSGRY